MPSWIHLVREGLSYGIVFILSSDRPPSSQLLELFRKRIVLSVSDRSLYSILLGGSVNTRKILHIPGRGYVTGEEPLEIQIAAPVPGPEEGWIAGLYDAGTLWLVLERSAPPQIRSLPDVLTVEEALACGCKDGKRKTGCLNVCSDWTTNDWNRYFLIWINPPKLS